MIPPTRYIDAGPGVPLANPQAAMVQGEAMARMGNTIAAIGEKGFQIAERVRKIDEGRKITALFANMEKDAHEFSLGLMAREDTEAWGGEWKEKSRAWQERAKEAGLSPEAMAAFDERYTRWDAQQSIGFETLAANKAVELGRATLSNSQDFHMSQRNYAAAQEDVELAHATGTISTPERDKLRMRIDETMRHDNMLDDINEDARGWTERNPVDKPAQGYDPVKWRQLHDYARGIAHDQDVATSESVLDSIITGQITTPEEIEAQTAAMRPVAKQKLLDALDRWNAEGAKAKREDPANIAANVGKFYSALGDWKPDPEGLDPAGVELRMMIESIPEGHPLRDKMRESMAARKSRMDGEVKTKLDQGLEVLKAAGQRGDFGPVKAPVARPVETRKAVNDGFLKDTRKMQKLGFSEDQAQAILKAAREDPALGQKKFNELWKERPGGSVNAEPFDIAVADALRGGNGTLQWDADIPPEEIVAHEQAVKAQGEAIIEFEKWIKLNPNASETDMGAKLRELGSKSARVAPQTSGPVKRPPARPAATPQPGETSMNLPQPLQPLAPVFETEGRKHGIDPRLLMAISMHETANGTSSAYRNKRNAMGVSDAKGPIGFDDPAESVSRMARVLASPKGPYRNARTLAEIGRIYAPPGAGNDPRGLNGYWTAGVSKYLRQLGGDPDRIFINS